jgi:hypothetical protein
MCLTEGEKINFLLKKEIKEEMKKKTFFDGNYSIIGRS